MRYFYIICFFFLITLSSEIKSQVDSMSNIEKTNQLESTFLILDAHSHHGFPSLLENEIDIDIKFLKDLDYDVINFALPIDRSKTDDLLSRISTEIKYIRNLSTQKNTFQIINSSHKLSDSITNDKLLFEFSIEYFYGVFDDNLSNIDTYKKLGVKYITFMNNSNEKLFDNSQQKIKLTEFGKQVIDRMNKVNLKIDISHLNENEMLEVIKYSSAPVIASHSNCKSIANLNYNISDEVLLELKDNNGMVMVSFNINGLFINKNEIKDGIEKLIDHIDYLKSTIGINNIGLGTDLQAHGKYIPSELNTSESFKKIIDCLKIRNYTESDIEKILYKNYQTFME